MCYTNLYVMLCTHLSHEKIDHSNRLSNIILLTVIILFTFIFSIIFYYYIKTKGECICVLVQLGKVVCPLATEFKPIRKSVYFT